ncbi:hypothetical protein GF373_04035 [bacterium]|nr:hypothetical protein [bacterium]
MNGFALRFVYLVFFVCFFLPLALAEFPIGRGEKLHMETKDGFVLYGKVISATAETAAIETRYGELQIPFSQIAKINGDLYDAAKGLIHIHQLTLQENGTVLMEYSHPISSRREEKSLNLLLPGKLLAALGLDGEAIPFSAVSKGVYTRAKVFSPTAHLPAIQVKILKKDALQIKNDTFQYTYRYVPAWDQEFHLQVKFPQGFVPQPGELEFEPLPDNTYLYKKQLTRQEKIVWRIAGLRK